MPTNIQEQIERRQERACEEILKIANKGSHPVFSQFEVKSVSGRAYQVEIRSLDELQNSCTCPDYKVMSPSPKSADFHTKLVFLTCFRTCDENEPEEL